MRDTYIHLIEPLSYIGLTRREAEALCDGARRGNQSRSIADKAQRLVVAFEDSGSLKHKAEGLEHIGLTVKEMEMIADGYRLIGENRSLALKMLRALVKAQDDQDLDQIGEKVLAKYMPMALSSNEAVAEG